MGEAELKTGMMRKLGEGAVNAKVMGVEQKVSANISITNPRYLLAQRRSIWNGDYFTPCAGGQRGHHGSRLVTQEVNRAVGHEEISAAGM
jgi:hypothetical protein